MIQSCRATFWLIVTCGGAGSGAPWGPWDVGGRHGWWVHVYLFLPTYIACHVSAIQKILSMCGVQDFAYVNNVETWYKNL